MVIMRSLCFAAAVAGCYYLSTSNYDVSFLFYLGMLILAFAVYFFFAGRNNHVDVDPIEVPAPPRHLDGNQPVVGRPGIRRMANMTPDMTPEEILAMWQRAQRRAQHAAQHGDIHRCHAQHAAGHRRA